MTTDLVRFLRQRDYKLIKEHGQGGCGKTVLLLDDVIDEHFVCKKYAPADSGMRDEFFRSFMTEIKLMHSAYHPNVVRIYGYYAYEAQLSGFILMEYVEGETIDKYVAAHRDSLPAVFRQTVDAFCHLEERGILHRDLRYGNILVRNDGVVKVIDLGFGKRVKTESDFEKSITLNWAFAPPLEFDNQKYDFQTEVYFVGKLFERIAATAKVDDGKVLDVLRGMCAINPSERFASFADVKAKIDEAAFAEPFFDDYDLLAYRSFARQLSAGVACIDRNAEYITNRERLLSSLEAVYRTVMLEETVASVRVCSCFVSGGCVAARNMLADMKVSSLQSFINLMRKSGVEQQTIILSNLHTRLNSIRRYDDDDIPF